MESFCLYLGIIHQAKQLLFLEYGGKCGEKHGLAAENSWN